MIYCVGLSSALKDIQKNLDTGFPFTFRDVEDFSKIENLNQTELFVIGPDIDQPVKYVQHIVAKDKLLSIIVLAEKEKYNFIKQSLQLSISVGKNTTSIIYNPSANYSTVFTNGIIRTKQKRKFKDFEHATEEKLSQLTSPSVKLNNLGHILEYAPIGAILIDKHLKIIGANKRSRHMFSHLNGSSIFLDSLFPAKYVDLIRTNRPDLKENVLTVEDFHGHVFEVSSSSLPDADSRHTILLLNDVTERNENDRRVSGILESLPQIAWTATPDGEINYYNQGWYDYTNTEASEGMGYRWTAFTHSDDSSHLLSSWNQSIRAGKPFQQAARFKRFDGTYRWHLSKAVPLFSKTKEILMWVGTFSDIHDQVMLMEDLEQKVKDRTKLLEETNAELEQFAHISSHDLQEPLRKIQTFADILRNSVAANEDVTRYVDKIIATSSRMSKLLKDLLSFTKINQQEAEALVDLTYTIHEIKEDLELQIHENLAGIHIENLPIIKVRPLQIKQLFYNLINNSLKYKKPGVAPVISIVCKPLDTVDRTQLKKLPGIRYWDIMVKDNGIGFEQQYSDQIFTVFQRLHSHSVYEGTGIGLAIAKKVVYNHGGEIFAISSPGNGAEFHIILPMS